MAFALVSNVGGGDGGGITVVFSMTVMSSSDRSIDPASSCDRFQSMLTFSN